VRKRAKSEERRAKSDAPQHGKKPGPGRGKGPRNGKLDYVAAAQAIAKGAKPATVAKKAGSKATTRKGQRSVGLRLIERIRTRLDIQERFDRIQYSIDEFALGVADAARNASRRVRIGGTNEAPEFAFDPDWDARTRARNQYLEACGLRQLPRESIEPPPASMSVGDELLQKVADGTASEAEMAEFLRSVG